MRLEYTLNEALPPLAWLAVVDFDAMTCSVRHGVFVETFDSFFFEGAWGSPFSAGRPDLAEVAFGSGCCRDEAGLCFVGSVATTDYLFYRTDRDTATVANSLPLLLAQTGDSLDPQCFRYAEISNSVMSGIHAHERDIPTRRGGVRRLLGKNLRAASGELHEADKPQPPALTAFADYEQHLRASYCALAENARDQRRRYPLHIFSTQSRGYDTTAINAIAAEHGLTGIFTIRTGKAGGSTADHANEREVDDDGAEIARQLGIGSVVAIERRAFARSFDDELYFLAGISQCQDANFKQVTDGIQAPALLLTGTLGEMWYTHAAWYFEHLDFIDDGLKRIDLGGHGLTEVRLRAGYIQAAIPYIGARRRVDIVRITESTAMDDWRLRTAYDRPIPRRIAEQAGVTRESFGQVKIGSVVEFAAPPVPQGRAIRDRYFAFLRREHVLSSWQVRLLPVVRRINEIVWFANYDRHRLLFYSMRIVSKLRGRNVQIPVIWNWLRGTLYCFAVNECANEYQTILDVDAVE